MVQEWSFNALYPYPNILKLVFLTNLQNLHAFISFNSLSWYNQWHPLTCWNLHDVGKQGTRSLSLTYLIEDIILLLNNWTKSEHPTLGLPKVTHEISLFSK